MNNRQIRATWRFEHVIATEVAAYETSYTTVSGGRAVRSEVGTGKDSLNAGDSVLILGSNRRDLPMAIGASPWIVG